MMKIKFNAVLNHILIGLSTVWIVAAEDLETKFGNAPEHYGPWRYHGWIAGNVTEESITRDMEEFSKEGGRGSLLFHGLDVGGGAQFVPARVRYLEPEWESMLMHFFRESDRLGQQAFILGGPFWDSDGGPWITEKNRMKVLTYTEQMVSGGELNGIVLDQPFTRDFYHDIACLAVPVPADEARTLADAALYSNSVLYQNRKLSLDGRRMEVGQGEVLAEEYIDIVFKKPFPVNYFTLLLPEVKNNVTTNFKLQFMDEENGFVSEDTKWFEAGSVLAGVQFNSIGFRPVRVSKLRVLFAEKIPEGITGISIRGTGGISNLQLKNGNDFAWGHGNGVNKDNLFFELNHGAADGIPANDVIDLTGNMVHAGRLSGSLPGGSWRIVRIGYTANPKYVRAGPQQIYAPADKLSPLGVQANYRNLTGRIVALARERGYRAPQGVYNDSYESRSQNWTETLPEEFEKRRGYSLHPYLPVLCGGHLIGGEQEAERFLRDFRRTLADLIAEYYFGERARLAQADGIRYYGDNSGAMQFMYDGVNYQKHADMPVGEFWVHSDRNWLAFPGFYIREDIKTAASAVHLYHPISRDEQGVMAESFTSDAHNLLGPLRMKAIADAAFCRGLTTICFHGTVLQPLDASIKPGLMWGRWGPLDGMPTSTWWEHMDLLSAYFARCELLLRSGRFVADFVYYVGDDIPNYLGYRHSLPIKVPSGYDFDGCDTGAIMDLFSVNEEGRIVCPNGMQYRFLMLPDKQTMPLHVLEKIAKLVFEGATVIGPKPVRTPGLTGGMDESDGRLSRLADKLWSGQSYGKGRVLDVKQFSEIEHHLSLRPDFSVDLSGIKVPSLNTTLTNLDPIEFIHRRDGDTDIYFVSSNLLEPVSVPCSFRISEKTPTLFDPVTGNIIRNPPYSVENGRTQLPIPLEKLGSVFVVFRSGGSLPTVVEKPEYHWTDLAVLDGPWSVTFDSAWGGPEAPVVFEKLVSWHTRPEEGIRHYSGKAVYTKAFSVPDEDRSGPALINLGNVRDVAAVFVNGKKAGVAWLPPYSVDITEYLKPGENDLKIEVINSWRNRLIGDEQHPLDFKRTGRWNYVSEAPEWILAGTKRPETNRFTFATYQMFEKDDAMEDAGLLGPVRILTGSMVE